MTGRTEEEIKVVEEYSKYQKLWRNPDITPEYNRVLNLDLQSIEPCVSGPKNPEDKINLNDSLKYKCSFKYALSERFKRR